MSAKEAYLKKGQRDKAIAKREASISRKMINRSNNATQIAFTFYVIAIAAKLAKIGCEERRINEEVKSFKEIFSIPDSEVPKIAEFYHDAVHDTVDARHYAMQLTNLLPNNRLILEELINDLFIFADADGDMTQEKVIFLKQIVLSLKFNENYFARILRKHTLKTNSDPFILLNVSQNVTYVDLKKAYRRAISDCHPDKFQHEGIIQDLKNMAAEQFQYYTQAYESIKIKKNFNKKVSQPA